MLMTLAMALMMFGEGTTITQSAEAVVYAKPDQVEIVCGHVARDSKCDVAFEQSNVIMNKIKVELTKNGISDDRIETVRYTISPPDYDEDVNPNGIRDYVVWHLIKIRNKDIDKTGSLIQAMIEAGANRIADITFSNSDPSRYYDMARDLAAKEARHRVHVYALSLGKNQGNLNLIEFQESESYTPDPRHIAFSLHGATPAAAPPISTSQIQYRIVVHTKWIWKD